MYLSQQSIKKSYDYQTLHSPSPNLNPSAKRVEALWKAQAESTPLTNSEAWEREGGKEKYFVNNVIKSKYCVC